MYELNKQISDLSNAGLSHAICFVTVLAKRLYPSYISFSNHTSFGDPDRLYEILLLGESALTSLPQYDEAQWQAMRTELLDLGPDTEDYPTAEASYALDACAACDTLLELLSKEDSNSLPRCAQLCFDSLSVYVQENGILDDAALSNHPLMEGEMNFQIGLIQQILAASENDLLTIIRREYPPLLHRRSLM
ncbi:MAG: DUF416 family protein [Bacteroidetes bacterium]|nr:DUF416 family protein [Bacteroidota bacterium]